MRRSLVVALALALGASGCTHFVVVSQSIAEMNRTRTAPALVDARARAPQMMEHAEELRSAADLADKQKDEVAADLLAERARVAYERAVVLARLSRATDEATAAKLSVAKSADEASELAAARASFEKAAETTASELAVARDAHAPAKVVRADPERERARLVAARSLAAEGHLLCRAGRLLAEASPSAPLMADAMSRLDVAEKAIDGVVLTSAPSAPSAPHALDPIEAAARARASCLDALTRTRRAAGSAEDADALLAQLSARGGLSPSRDERGVVVTLRGAWKGTALTPDAERDLRELGRIAAAHRTYPVELVVHDGTPPTEREHAEDVARGRAARAAMSAGGAAVTDANVETVGAALPILDPTGPDARARNARLEVVFVSGE
jgi:hypothetical protein